ncbi:hypothetical protein HMPREF9998_01313 [Peptostreptococcus anaerobius VPI 4330 = DSM 2949]|nr:hypothetical protein HMPREF9998_01313 [Peptostreptococcus anaerobius VPI 4330 = DSM 2949]
MWVVQGITELVDKNYRITPTCVGSTSQHCLNQHTVQDHPHVCG